MDNTDHSILASTMRSDIFAQTFFGTMLEWHENPDAHRGFRTGIPELDTLLGGLFPGWFFVVGGAEKMGKTAFMLSLAKFFGEQGRNFAWFSFEEGHHQMGLRVFSNVSGIPKNRFRDLQLTAEDWPLVSEAMERIARWDAHWNYGTSNLKDFKAVVREIDPDILFVDYIQLMTDDEGRHRSRREEIAKISLTLKRLSVDTKIVAGVGQERTRLVIAGSQLARDVAKAGSWDNPYGFLESGSIGRDCDVGIIIAPVIDLEGREAIDKRKIYVVLSRHSEKADFLVSFFGARSLVGGSTEKQVDVKEMVNQYLDGSAKSDVQSGQDGKQLTMGGG